MTSSYKKKPKKKSERETKKSEKKRPLDACHVSLKKKEKGLHRKKTKTNDKNCTTWWWYNDLKARNVARSRLLSRERERERG